MADLKGKVAVVTGASRGVGKGIAEGLAEAGATVYVTGRSASRDEPPADRTVQATARSVDELGGRGVAVELDHTNDAAVAEFFAELARREDRLDVLINNAFQIPNPPVWSGKFWEHPLSVWDDQCGVGLRGYYTSAVYAAPLMIQGDGGLLVNVSSLGATGYAFSTAYGVGKSGVDRMARDMAIELADYGVAALSLHPGVVTTEFVLDAIASGDVQLDLAAAESPRFIGRCIAALAMDPDIMEKTGGNYRVAELACEYRFTDPDRVR